MPTTDSEITFTVKVTLDEHTLSELKSNDFSLYAFRAIDNSSPKAAPLIMFTVSDLKKELILKFNDSEYLGYISTQELIEFQQIFISKPVVPTKRSSTAPTRLPPQFISNTSIKVTIGQLVVIDDSGNLSIKTSTLPNEIQIRNNSSQKFLTGLGTIIADKSIPFSAQHIFSGQTVSIKPKNGFLMVFSNNRKYKNGTYLTSVGNRGMLINALEDGTRSIAYDIDLGWENDHQSWGKNIAGGIELSQTLVNQ